MGSCFTPYSSMYKVYAKMYLLNIGGEMFTRLKASRVGLAFMAAALLLPFVSVLPASASATGCSYFGNMSIGGVPLPVYRGSYCAKIDGYKRSTSEVLGSFSSAGNICNWNITAEFFNKSGKWLRTFNGSYNSGCKVLGGSRIVTSYTMAEDGYMCSTLKTNGKRITSVCHSIHL